MKFVLGYMGMVALSKRQIEVHTETGALCNCFIQKSLWICEYTVYTIVSHSMYSARQSASDISLIHLLLL